MANKRPKPEEIVTKLRQVEVLGEDLPTEAMQRFSNST
jgi:hypothetical protein